jgi:hypothetical protein
MVNIVPEVSFLMNPVIQKSRNIAGEAFSLKLEVLV